MQRVFSRTQEYGGNIGPLIPFGSLKKKMFFFLNFERSYSPITNARTVTVLSPSKLKAAKREIISRNPDQDLITTAHIERNNLTVRTRMRRLTRLASGFSKKSSTQSGTGRSQIGSTQTGTAGNLTAIGQVGNGGMRRATQNFVDLSTSQPALAATRLLPELTPLICEYRDFLCARIDPWSKVTDVREDNNTGCTQINIVGRP